MTIFSFLKNKLKCAFCREINCQARWHYPKKQIKYSYDGTVKTVKCRKEQTVDERIEEIINENGWNEIS